MKEIDKQRQLRDQFEKLQDEAATLIALGNQIFNADNIARNIATSVLTEDIEDPNYDYSSKFEQINNAIKIGEYSIEKSINLCGKTAGRALVGKCTNWETEYSELFSGTQIDEELYNDMLAVAPELSKQVKMAKHAGQSLELLEHLPKLQYYAKQDCKNLAWPYLTGGISTYLNLLWLANTEEDLPIEYCGEEDLDGHFNTLQKTINTFLVNLEKQYGPVPTPVTKD